MDLEHIGFLIPDQEKGHCQKSDGGNQKWRNYPDKHITWIYLPCIISRRFLSIA